MSIKKQIKDTIGISLGATAISEANKIPGYGNLIGSTIGAGLVLKNSKYKKGGY